MGSSQLPVNQILANIDDTFTLTTLQMKTIVKDFHLEMERGLCGQESSLKMLPAFVCRATGSEQGKYIALDLGGTNFRVLEVELKGRGKIGLLGTKKYSLNKRHMEEYGEVLFDFIADCIKEFMSRELITKEEKFKLGFTFSFPVKQTAIDVGTLVCWSKGFRTKGVVGKDVVELLNKSLIKEGVSHVVVAALANDTVGTLVARSYQDPCCDVGVILGTGTNACYPEKIVNITKDKTLQLDSGEMIINIEWGCFDKISLTKYDKQLDKMTINPGLQLLEKMVSGMYLGELSGLVLQDLIEHKALFNGNYQKNFVKHNCFPTEHMSQVAGDNSAELVEVEALLKKIKIADSSLPDRQIVKKICQIVAKRSARLSAALIAAVVTKMDPELTKEHHIAVDGTLYEKFPGYNQKINCALEELFSERACHIKSFLVKDGSGKGAAVIAAVAAASNNS